MFFSFSGTAQIVNIPDVNFKFALVNDDVADLGNGFYETADTNGDGEIQETEAVEVVRLSVSFYDISSLEGIQSFINIEVLHCSNNQLSSLDFSQNLNLVWITCGGNILNNIDVTQNLNLINLWCDNNQLSNLDVTQNLNLRSLACSGNQLNELDLSQNITLEGLECENNQLTSLNIKNGNNHNLQNMFSLGNVNLNCIQVDDENATYPECEGFPIVGWCKDNWTVYSVDCTLGVENALATQVSLYPNPVQNLLNLQSQVSLKSIEVYDILGKLVLEKQSVVNQINLSKLASGLLFIKIETDQGVVTKKIIKQ